MTADYDATVEQVHRAFADKTYWQARLADSGADDATLDGLDVGPDGSIDVSTTQALRRDRLPGIATQFHKGDLHIVRREQWGPVTAATATAGISGDIPGAPVTLAGSAVLSATAGWHIRRGCGRRWKRPPTPSSSTSDTARCR